MKEGEREQVRGLEAGEGHLTLKEYREGHYTCKYGKEGGKTGVKDALPVVEA